MSTIVREDEQGQRGWVCPKCGVSVAPHLDVCPVCSFGAKPYNYSVQPNESTDITDTQIIFS